MTKRILGCALCLFTILGLHASTAFAGGPLIIFDPFTQTPYSYAAAVSVFTDLGDNGVLSGADSDVLTSNGYAQWTGVPTASFSGAVAGDFSAVGLPNITGANAGLVVGTFNGGGIHVMYDDDGTIVANFFGAPPGVLGIASPEWAATGTKNLLESWTVVNGTAADPADVGGASFGGVFTHEFGHTINLAHTQLNGATGFFSDGRGPGVCLTPYPPAPLTLAHFETMYPFLNPSAGNTGVHQATVDLLDDVAAVSDVYPDAGWPATHASISGRVFAPDGTTELTGINVIVRNVANPFGNGSSTLSGAFTQGDIGPDGRFTFNGLTPGASYVVYIDEIVAGGFSTPPSAIPGDGSEEYWNIAEGATAATDPPCDVTAILAGAAGSTFTADVIGNGDPDALDLGDDDFVQVALPFSFPFCGGSYSSVFVNSNGNLTFGSGSTDFTESVLELLGGPPRIALLWDDLNPGAAGTVTAKTIGADFVVTFTNVPEFFSTGSNTFAVTMRADGTYDVSYGLLTAPDGIVGRTEGVGAANPGETDLSAAAQPIGAGMATVYESFSTNDNDLDNLLLAFGACVIPDPPSIDVDPDALSAVLLPGESATQTLQISNLGDLDLEFEVASDQLSVAAIPTTARVILPVDLGTLATPSESSNQARLDRMNQDRQATRADKPDVSPYAVPLPHAFALGLLEEDFNAGFPAGWSVVDNETNGVSWMVPQQGTGNHTGGTGNAAGANSDFTGPAEFDTELRTPAISGFGPNVVLSYRVNYANFAFLDFLDVDVSTDGGTTWTNVLSWNEDHGGFFSPPGEQVALNLDAFVQGNPSFIVRWRYYDPNSGDWDWYAQIDDVMIVSDEVLTACSYLTVDPTSGTVSGDGTADIDVTFDATGFTPGTYDCELIIFSNAVNTNRLVVPLEMIVVEEVTVDIMPSNCPNIVSRHNEGGNDDDDDDDDVQRFLQVAIIGSSALDVTTIDLSSIRLAGVPASTSTVRDVYRLNCSFGGDDDDDDDGPSCTYKQQDVSNECTSSCAMKDGFKDVVLYFNEKDVVNAVGPVPAGQVNQVTLTGLKTGGIHIQGSDCLIILDGGDDVAREGGIAGTRYSLGPNVPNPFNPVTRFSYYVPKEAFVTLSVYDVAGRLLEQLVSGVKTPGDYEVSWDAKTLPTGIYFYRLEAGDFVQTRKMILLK
jgi:hypothetical protein